MTDPNDLNLLTVAGSSVMLAPAAHHNIGHTCDVLRACRECRFDRLILELPGDLQRFSAVLCDAASQLGPTPGAVFFPRDRVRLPVPDRADPGVLRVRDVLTGIFVPIGADSISAALWLSLNLPGWHPEVVFADAETSTYEQSEDRMASHIDEIDAAYVERLGTAGFYARWAPYIASRIPAEPSDLIREEAMTWHIRRAQEDNVRALCIPGAAHVERMLARLASNSVPERAPSTRTARSADEDAFRVFALPPAASYACFGWMQDMPYLTGRFWQHVLAGRFEFDRHQLMLEMLATAHQRSGGRLTPRQMIHIAVALEKATATAGRMRFDLPRLAATVRSIAGEGFADFLVHEIALDYPVEATPDLPQLDVLPAATLGHFLFDDRRDEVYLLPVPQYRQESLPSQSLWIRGDRLRCSTMSRSEERRYSRDTCRIKAPKEEQGSRWMNKLTRQLAHRKDEATADRPRYLRSEWLPDLQRVDWNRTLRARAFGDSHTYIERHPVARSKSAEPCEFCAAVYLLGPFHRTCSRTAGYYADPDGHRC